MFKLLEILRPDSHDPEIKALIKERWGNFTEEIQAEIGHLEQEYTKSHDLAVFSVLLGFIGSGLIYGIVDGSVISLGYNAFGISDSLRLLLFLLGLALVTTSLFLVSPVIGIRIRFNIISNPIFYSKAFQILEIDAIHSNNQLEIKSKIVTELEQSGLLREVNNNLAFDDIISAKYRGRDLLIAELAGNRVKNKFINNDQSEYLFHGLFVSYQLPQTLSGVTFITTKGDSRVFSTPHIGRKKIKKDFALRETSLEWNDFNNTLNVVTTNEVEARYILTPDFMQSLHDWWYTRRGNVRVSFVGDRLYVLYPDVRVQLGVSSLNLKEKSLQDYVLTIVRPLWHIEQLIKHTGNRFR